MRTITTRACVELKDASGYFFIVYVTGPVEPYTDSMGLQPTREGWKAEVTLGHHHSGAATIDGALTMVLDEARQLVRMLEEALDERPDAIKPN